MRIAPGFRRVPVDEADWTPDSPESMSQKHTASPLLIVGVATLLGAFSTFQAYQFVRLFSEKPQPLARSSC